MGTSTVVERLERVIEAVTARCEHQLFDVLLPGFGDAPFDTPTLDSEEQALYWCPEYVVFCHAHPLVAMAYWTLLEQQLNANQPFAWEGDKDLAAFDRRMQKLLVQYPHAAIDGMTPELASALAELIADGLHDGTIKQPVSAVRTES